MVPYIFVQTIMHGQNLLRISSQYITMINLSNLSLSLSNFHIFETIEETLHEKSSHGRRNLDHFIDPFYLRFVALTLSFYTVLQFYSLVMIVTNTFGSRLTS